MALFEEVPNMPQMRQEMVKMYPNNSEEQGNFYSMLNGNNNASAPEVSNDEISWDWLWNMDNVHGNFSLLVQQIKSLYKI
ncbi:hypothetical protein Lalb_Chr03g0036911 [Lupinus albus]|uniref:Uncharacterized protein n=1 Tax=Lupinus albus TaxID=3870 RepID=A0A6A4QWH0_LUPAL|nr:hypothetical protein Lalb_Chr03g0036911 [Lupinus albus]